MKDFTLSTYKTLLAVLQQNDYRFQTFRQFLAEPAGRVAILRHDVDTRKSHAHQFARIQHDAGIKGTYYFRIVPQSFDESLIREIAALGHEIGYHYEDMDFARGNPRRAIRLFEQHLERFRKIVPVSTICMHGSPRSRYDNRDLWKYFDYHNYGIIGEPYFDVDYKNVFYLTDTGRRWDGSKVSVRDKVQNSFDITFHSTPDIIEALGRGSFPDKALFTFHPQRWTDNPLLWARENISQRLKNAVKYWLASKLSRQH